MSSKRTANKSGHFVRMTFSFPNPVNEIAARLVAAMTLGLCLATITAFIYDSAELWLLIPLVYEFLARVLTGPTLSPIGFLASKVLAPRIGNRPVPGPPKRFAQSIGLTISTTALVIYLVSDSIYTPIILLTIISVFAALEAFAGFCAGCFVFKYLMSWGLVPDTVCRACEIDVEALKLK